MKFATAKEHRDFFQKNGWIEFDEFLSADQLDLTNSAIDRVLAERLNKTPAELRFASSEDLYLQGRDVWRMNPQLRKLVTQTRFAEIASDLIEKKPLRLGYDQLLPTRNKDQKMDDSKHVYATFLEQTANLEAVSCLRDVSCGLVLSLGASQEGVSELASEGIDIFPRKAGNVIFFRPDAPVKWDNLYTHQGERYYLIVYTQATAHYILQPHDPHTHALKRLGYIFNDRLKDNLHPIVYR